LPQTALTSSLAARVNTLESRDFEMHHMEVAGVK
jgi:hypothetical protein